MRKARSRCPKCGIWKPQNALRKLSDRFFYVLLATTLRRDWGVVWVVPAFDFSIRSDFERPDVYETRYVSLFTRIFLAFFGPKSTLFLTKNFPKIEFVMAEHLASIFGTEKDRVNCPFYFKVRRHNNTHRFEEKRSLFCFFPIKVETNRSRIGTMMN